jgi:hypothetical protein
MKKNIIAIQVDTKPVRWVHSTYPRPGKLLGAEYTDKKHEAMEFPDYQSAHSCIKKLMSLNDRNFTPVPLDVDGTAKPEKSIVEGKPK